MNVVFSPAQGADVFTPGLTALLSAGTHLALYKSSAPPDPNNPSAAQFVPADFDGYAAIATPFMGAIAVRDALTGGWKITDALRTFAMTGNTTPNLIYGAYVYSGGIWICAWPFQTAYPMVDATSALSIVPFVSSPPQPIAGSIEPIG